MSRARGGRFALLAALGVVLVLAIAGSLRAQQSWSSASRESAGLAPDAASTPEAVVQVYAARVWGWRGLFGSHTWVAVKPSNAARYTVYEVIGWRLRWSESVVVIAERTPDARWFGSNPELLADRRGEGVDALIERIDQAARSYPWGGEYRLWPGPNSNTFTAWITRAVPELGADLPPLAIGKDYLGERLFGAAPSGSGVQFSLAGLLGFTASAIEGIEVNLLGLSFGVHPADPALRLPILGRIGPARFGTPTPALEP
jgi:hypothetical protein